MCYLVQGNRHQLNLVQVSPSAGLTRSPSPSSPENRFSYVPKQNLEQHTPLKRQESPVSPSAYCTKVAPLLYSNKKPLMSQFSSLQEKENGADEKGIAQQANDCEKADGTFAKQRQRLKSAHVSIKVFSNANDLEFAVLYGLLMVYLYISLFGNFPLLINSNNIICDGMFLWHQYWILFFSLKLLQKEALERVLQDNRRQNEALRREFLHGEQQSQ